MNIWFILYRPLDHWQLIKWTLAWYIIWFQHTKLNKKFCNIRFYSLFYFVLIYTWLNLYKELDWKISSKISQMFSYFGIIITNSQLEFSLVFFFFFWKKGKFSLVLRLVLTVILTAELVYGSTSTNYYFFWTLPLNYSLSLFCQKRETVQRGDV